MIRRLLDDPVVNVQRAAMDLVTHLSPERARGILRGVLARPDPEESLHGLALLLLRDIGGPEDVAAVLALVRAKESDFLAVQAVGALGEMEGRLGTRSCLPELRRILEDPEADYALVSTAITALHQVGNPSFLPLLAARLREAEGHPRGDEIASLISALLGRRIHGEAFKRPESAR